MPGLVGVTLVAAGGATTSAAGPAGVWCWGANDRGQLGVGDTTDRSAPTPVPGLVGVTDLSVGEGHACAVGATGLQCWGGNDAGQLGNGSVIASSTPVAVPVTSPVEVVAMELSTCARSSDGS
ncbi:MAG: hypothetical protein V9G12_20320, partial [Microthrixaceae bacterium]